MNRYVEDFPEDETAGARKVPSSWLTWASVIFGVIFVVAFIYAGYRLGTWMAS